MYDPSGQCVEQPAEPEPFCQRIRIRSYPVEEYLGLIFAYLGEGDPPPLPRFPEFEDEADAVRFNMTYTWPCNYFNSLENDPYHGLWVHRDSYQAAGRVAIPTVTCAETDYGYAVHTTRPGGGHTTVSHRLWPNASYGRRTRSTPDGVESGATALGPGVWRGAAAWRVPIDDEHFASFDVQMTHVRGEARQRYEAMLRSVNERSEGLLPAEVLGAAVLRGEMRIDDIADRHVNGNRLFNLQDYCSQVAQGVVADRAHEDLGREDATLVLQRQIWRRELRALAEGRPLKQWARPDAALAVGETRTWA
jgi:5,5'-dehydrodivanillate O-demethylase